MRPRSLAAASARRGLEGLFRGPTKPGARAVARTDGLFATKPCKVGGLERSTLGGLAPVQAPQRLLLELLWGLEGNPLVLVPQHARINYRAAIALFTAVLPQLARPSHCGKHF